MRGEPIPCAASGCERPAKDGLEFCGPCWRRLPEVDRTRLIEAAHRHRHSRNLTAIGALKWARQACVDRLAKMRPPQLDKK